MWQDCGGESLQARSHCRAIDHERTSFKGRIENIACNPKMDMQMVG